MSDKLLDEVRRLSGYHANKEALDRWFNRALHERVASQYSRSTSV